MSAELLEGVILGMMGLSAWNGGGTFIKKLVFERKESSPPPPPTPAPTLPAAPQATALPPARRRR
jgi:hypothetical protein